MERDVGVLNGYHCKTTISTHTLTWSVTVVTISSALKNGNFNSHAHVERDMNIYQLVNFTRHFNSHAHVERDALKFYNDKTTLNFNSHAHVERDSLNRNRIFRDGISTHTLTWSVTF